MDRNSYQQLQGVALITGAASGIGRACAHAFAAAGCRRFALLDVDRRGLEAVHSLLHKVLGDESLNIVTAVCDVSNEDEVKQAFAVVLASMPRIDYAVNCAGINQEAASTTEISAAYFDRVVGINLRGAFLCSREELRVMRSQNLDSDVYQGIPSVRGQRGAIVDIASALGVVAMTKMPAYCSSKAGVIAMARSDALDHASDRIRVNSILPGPIATTMSTSNKDLQVAVEKSAISLHTPLKRWGLAEEVADACVFLCSNAASFIQGAALPVDGGYLTN